MTHITDISLLAGSITINARYAAFSFYQDRKGSPLTEEEMKEIADQVYEDIGLATRQITEAMVAASSEEEADTF